MVANVGAYVLYVLVISMYNYRLSTVLDPIMLILIFGRLLVLPIAYKKLENSKNFELVANFIKRLKRYPHLKIIVLIVAYFSYLPMMFPYYYEAYSAYSRLLQGLYLGLLGNYLVLFAYWFIEDLIKKIILKK